MAQAIRTTFIPWTEHKPDRVKASCERGANTYMKSVLEESAKAAGHNCIHRAAAQALCDQFTAEDQAKHGPDAGKTWQVGFVTGEFQHAFYHVFVE